MDSRIHLQDGRHSAEIQIRGGNPSRMTDFGSDGHSRLAVSDGTNLVNELED